MPKVMRLPSGRLIRICPTDCRRVECSDNNGCQWNGLSSNVYCNLEEFLEVDGHRITAITKEGKMMVSNNDGVQFWPL